MEIRSEFHWRQGCRNFSILPSRMGEHGVSLENMGKIENMEKVENMEMFSRSPTEMFSGSLTDIFSGSPTLFTQFIHSILYIYRGS